MTAPRRWLAPTLGLIVLGLAVAAEARPGGGQSYSGGSSSHSSGGSSYSGGSRSSGSSWSSSSSSSGGGGGGGSLIGLLLAVVIGIPLKLAEQMKSNDNNFDSSYAPPPQPPPPRPSPQALFDAIRERDPEFSAVLFEDFVFALYARVHAARGDAAAMAALAPYVSEGSRAALLHREPAGAKIHGVVVGRMQVERVRLDDRIAVDLRFESNLTADLPHGPQGFYIQETWTLERGAQVRSKPPEAVQNFQCPACGAPYQRTDQGACGHCGQQVEDGRFDWTVTFVRQQGIEPRPPALTGDVQEVGTGYPTVFSRDIVQQHAHLVREDPGASAPHIERRLHDIYGVLNDAWTARDLRPIRPHVSDALYNYLAYWIDAYRNQGLTNVLKDMEISRMQIVKLVRDKHFDAVTVRFWAAGLDYTTDLQGRRVSGSSTSKRAYSEYWTLIRGARVRGAPRDPATCPGCGAALDRVSMAGNCEYCGSHLTRGEFDWVLSKIEQDESYTG